MRRHDPAGVAQAIPSPARPSRSETLMRRVRSFWVVVMEDLYEMPGHLIRRVQQVSSALFAEECAEFDITSVQFAALVMIQSNPDVDATRLSELIAFDRSTIGGVLERLENKGLIRRSSKSTDKRVKLVRLTTEGQKLLRLAEPAVRRVQQRLMEPLSPQDRAVMLRLLGQLAAVHNDLTPVPLRLAAVSE